MTGIILAAGVGERLSNDESRSTCKPLKIVNGIPLINYSLDLLKDTDVSRVIIVVGKYFEEIKQAVGNSYGGMDIDYELQKEQKGLSNAIFCGSTNCDDDVVVLLADELFIDSKMSECLETFKSKRLDYIATYTKESDPEKIKSNFSFELNDNNEPFNFIEKPKYVVNDMKGTGVSVFSKRSVDVLKNKYDEQVNKPDTLCDYFELLNSEGLKGGAFEFAKVEVNVNTAEDLISARNLLEKEVK